MKTSIGKKRLYNKNYEGMDNVVHWDVLNIKCKQDFYLDFINTNSQYKQGVRLAVDVGEGYVEVGGYKAKGVYIWEDSFDDRIKIKCYSPEGLLSIYNVFERNEKRMTLTDSCGMLVETTGNKTLYKCNDYGFEPNFDKLIFQIELL